MITKYIAKFEIESSCDEEYFSTDNIKAIITEQLYEHGALIDKVSVEITEEK